jgi:hypothetical protein
LRGNKKGRQKAAFVLVGVIIPAAKAAHVKLRLRRYYRCHRPVSDARPCYGSARFKVLSYIIGIVSNLHSAVVLNPVITFFHIHEPPSFYGSVDIF